jgi:ABC-type transporter Mla subunit MlaD
MRRLLSIALALGAAAAIAAALLSASAQGSSTATFDVIFDDARGLVAGQLVKVAGAQAGSIQNVTVVKQGSGANTSYKAKIEASIDSKFMPFRANATCTIRPEGLIAENYVQCDPGSPPAPVLPSAAGRPPTVPVQNTTEPVSLLDLFNIFNVPTRERFTLILNELGIGTAARGQDLNDILYRADPALRLADQVIGILARQKTELAALIDATNTIAQQAATHTGAVQNFLQQASTLASTTAQHRSNLALAIKRLPALLAAAQPSLAQLDVVAREGTPLVKQLGTAAPYLNQASLDLGPFVAAAKPGLSRLSQALTKAIPAVKHATPLTKALHKYTTDSMAKTKLSGRLFTSLQQAGFGENFLGIVYYVVSSLARFDPFSHLLSFATVDLSQCIPYAAAPVPGCSANFGAAPASASMLRGTRASSSRASHTRASSGGERSAGSRSAPNSSGTSAPTPGATSTSPGQRAQPTTPAAQPTAPSSQPAGGATNALQNLVNFLLR